MEEIIELQSNKAHILLGDAEEELKKYLREGRGLGESLRLAGISRFTFTEWMLKGSDPKAQGRRQVCPPHIHVEPFYSYARRIREAEDEGKRSNRPIRRRGQNFPADITYDQKRDILYALRQGWSYHEACKYAQVRLSTFLSWLHLGGYPKRVSMALPVHEDDRQEKYVSFVKEVLRAEDEFFTG